jgi:catechol 2,3-dioxygenase-like lactoylglutathione lyase family enzyme
VTISLGAVTPLIPVRDVAAAITFYRDKLGFTETWHEGNAAGLRRDAAEIVLTRCPGPDAIFEWTSFRVAVSGIAALYDACGTAGIVHPNGALQDRPWGTSEFAVLDPDGICITFWERRMP